MQPVPQRADEARRLRPRWTAATTARKLGASELDGAAIEEWKVEAFHDEKKRKDLFVTFLYFRNNRFVDGSDTRIDYRNNPEPTERWKNAPQR